MKLFCVILKWWIHVIIRLSEPTECTTPRVSFNVNYELWGTILCQSCHSVMSNALWLQHARLPCPSPSPSLLRLMSIESVMPPNRLSSVVSSSVVSFSACLQSFPASGPFQMSRPFASVGQSIGASASVLPMSIQGWFPLGWTGLIFWQSKGLSRVFSNTTV